MYEDVVLTEEQKDEEYQILIKQFPGIKERDILRGYARALHEMSVAYYFKIYEREKEAWKKGASLDDLDPIISESVCSNCGNPYFDCMSPYICDIEETILEKNVKRVDKYWFDIATDFASLEKKLGLEAEGDNKAT